MSSFNNPKGEKLQSSGIQQLPATLDLVSQYDHASTDEDRALVLNRTLMAIDDEGLAQSTSVQALEIIVSNSPESYTPEAISLLDDENLIAVAGRLLAGIEFSPEVAPLVGALAAIEEAAEETPLEQFGGKSTSSPIPEGSSMAEQLEKLESSVFQELIERLHEQKLKSHTQVRNFFEKLPDYIKKQLLKAYPEVDELLSEQAELGERRRSTRDDVRIGENPDLEEEANRLLRELPDVDDPYGI